MLDAVSLAADATSSPTSVTNQDKASIHLVWTGTSPVGTLAVQARNGELDSWYALDFGEMKLDQLLTVFAELDVVAARRALELAQDFVELAHLLGRDREARLLHGDALSVGKALKVNVPVDV